MRDTMLADMHDHPGHLFDPKHIHKLEDPERLKWLPVDSVLERLNLRPGMVVADVGAGTGFFAIPIARRISPGGQVVAVDSQDAMLSYLRTKLADKGLPIELVKAEAGSLTLADDSADIVFLANVWHEIDDRAAAAREARRVLHKGGNLAVLDWRPECPSPPGPPVDHRISAAQVRTELSSLGFSVPEAVNVGEYSYLILAT